MASPDRALVLTEISRAKARMHGAERDVYGYDTPSGGLVYDFEGAAAEVRVAIDDATKALALLTGAPISLSVSIALTDPAAATEVAERVAQVVAEMGHGSVVAVVPLDGAS